ncbi:MAG: hypothetical protein J6W84_04970 [Bacteroidales bacterium]|nr:hypothetical protein [Bacteroidales bacterium]
MADNIKSMNLNITVDDGYQRVPITNKYGDEIGVFYFNPTDIGIIERYNTLAETFDAITEPLEAVNDAENADPDIIEARQIEALDKAKERLYEAVDKLFGGNAAEAFFGKVHPFSPVDGNFYCENVLQAVGEFISKQFDSETKKLSARVEKYTNRAQRRAKK